MEAMSFLYKMLAVLCVVFANTAHAQQKINGKIIDANSKEPLAGATIRCTDAACTCGCISNAAGVFELKCHDCQQHSISSIGYTSRLVVFAGTNQVIELIPIESLLQTVVVSANRGEIVRRSEAPIAIASLNAKTIQDTRPITIDQVLNKVSGVNMVNLGNEQHQMSIRQPMTTKSLFLYLQDGIPVRTTGLFNHNALLEINMAATRKIEVIKGPSSSLYGSEAIGGVVNFISIAPSAVPVAKVALQGNDIGYKRLDFTGSYSKDRWGFVVSGYYADKRNDYLEYSDFHKGIVTTRIDYRFSDKTSLTNNFTILNYYSDMSGAIDSSMFASKTFSNLHSFTYRKVQGVRHYSTLSHNWNRNSKTTATVLFRDNAIGQNPAYRVKDDYRKQGNSFVGKKDLAHGEINESSFNSYSFIAQHKQNIAWKNAVLTTGASVDLSPSDYSANYIAIKRDSINRKYLSYKNTDSVLTNYSTRLNNYAGFVNVEFSPVTKLRVVASLRYDVFNYRFDNHLAPSAFSGSRDTANDFKRVSPKVGFTYNFSARTGLYANYSEGFVPPQVTEMYTGVKVPNLDAATFSNYEIGGWAELVRNRLTMDVSAYILNGSNEIVSVKLDDGSFVNQNAGKTKHEGIEFGINATPAKGVSFRLSGAYSKHTFVDYVEKGTEYNGNEMNNAPNWIYNAEAWYKPSFVPGLRLGVEVQKVGSYYVDPKNTARYEGYTVLNARVGYQFKGIEVWVNMINTTNEYYSYITTRSNSGYSYQLAEPRNFCFGVSYDIGTLCKK
jgi:iron complex outermembrane recepter protein